MKYPMPNKRATKKSEWHDHDDAPDTSTPYWQKTIDATPIPRGRPRIAEPKISTKLRLDADILAKLKEGGTCWQARINENLCRLMEKVWRIIISLSCCLKFIINGAPFRNSNFY